MPSYLQRSQFSWKYLLHESPMPFIILYDNKVIYVA